MTGVFKFAGLSIVVGCAAWFTYWNEYESPWGRDVQAHKIEILRAKLCP